MRRVSALVAATATLAGCGGGDAEQNVVEIRGDEYAYVMPASIEGGWTTMRLENTGKEAHEFALAKLDGDRTRADVLAVLSRSGDAGAGACRAGCRFERASRPCRRATPRR